MNILSLGLMIGIFFYFQENNSMLMMPSADTMMCPFKNTFDQYFQTPEFRNDYDNIDNHIEKFLHYFGENSLQSLSLKFCELSPKDGAKLMTSLNDNQKILVRLSCLPNDSKISVVSFLFNGNREVAQECCKLSINTFLENYPNVEEAQQYYIDFIKYHSYIKLQPEMFKFYCLNLRPSQIELIIEGLKSGVINRENVINGIDIFNRLLFISINNDCNDIKKIGSIIRIQPSCIARLRIMYLFCKKVIKKSCKLWAIRIVLMSKVYDYYADGIGRIVDRTELLIIALFIIGIGLDQYPKYKTKMDKLYGRYFSLTDLLLNYSWQELYRKYGDV